MAIDPSIALSYQPPQIQVQMPQPLQQFGQILTLGNLMQQRQLLPIELQTKQLQLDQLRIEMEERRQFAADLAGQYGSDATQGTTAAPLPALTGQPPAVSAGPALVGQPPSAAPLAGGTSDLMNLPTIDRGAQMASLAAAPDGLLPLPPPATALAPAPSLAAMMATPTPAPAPAVPAPVAAPAASGGLLGMNIGRMVAKYPNIGPGIANQILTVQKNQTELAVKQHEEQQKRWEAMAGAAQAVTESKNPAAEYQTQLMDLYNGGYINAQELAGFRDHGYDPDKMAAWKNRAVSQVDLHNIARTDLAAGLDDRKQAAQDINAINTQDDYVNKFLPLHPKLVPLLGTTFTPQLKGIIQNLDTTPGERFQQGAEKTAQMAQLLTDPKQIPAFIAAQPAEAQPYLQKIADSGATLDQFKQYVGTAALKPGAGVTVPKPASVIAQEIGLTGAKKIAEIGAESQAYDPVVQSVLKGDVKLQDLPPELQGKIMRPLIQSGYTGLGKRVSDTELAQIDAYNNALTMLKSTQTDLQDPTNRSYMGWATGALAHVPGVRNQINKMQGDLSLTQQKLKNFISNKSLRGLNEQTLENTFPSVSLAPSVNDYRVNKLIEAVQTERDQYMKDLTAGGKVLPSAAPTGAPAAAPPAETPATNTPAWQSPVKIEIQKPQGSATVQLSPAQQTAVPATPAPPGKVAAIKPDGKGGWKGGFINAKDVDAARRQGVIVP